MLLKIILLIIWLIAGVLAMLTPRISKFSYFCVWLCLLLYLIKDVIQ